MLHPRGCVCSDCLKAKNLAAFAFQAPLPQKQPSTGSPIPEWQVSGGDFWATFHFAHSNDAVRESRPESELAVSILGLLTQATMGKTELAQKLGHRTVSGELNKQVRLLLKDGFIEMTLPEKPNSRLQRYCLTALGQGVVAASEGEAGESSSRPI